MQPFLPQPLDRAQFARLRRAAPAIMTRAQTLKEASAVADFYLATPPLRLEPKAAQALEAAGPDRLRDIHRQLAAIENWDAPEIEQALKTLAAEQGVKIGQIFMPLRAALSGSMQSPGVVELAFAFGRDKTLAHLAALING
jgi:glutamyl-tRNA synthetase